MDTSKTGSLQGPQDNSEEQSDLKNHQMGDKCENLGGDGFSLVEDGNRKFRAWKLETAWKTETMKENRGILLNFFSCGKEICCNTSNGGKLQLLLAFRDYPEQWKLGLCYAQRWVCGVQGEEICRKMGFSIPQTRRVDQRCWRGPSCSALQWQMAAGTCPYRFPTLIRHRLWKLHQPCAWSLATVHCRVY